MFSYFIKTVSQQKKTFDLYKWVINFLSIAKPLKERSIVTL